MSADGGFGNWVTLVSLAAEPGHSAQPAAIVDEPTPKAKAADAMPYRLDRPFGDAFLCLAVLAE